MRDDEHGREKQAEKLSYPSCEAEIIPKSDITARPRTVSTKSMVVVSTREAGKKLIAEK